ncbi:sialate O-acetylesterase [uncultured Bacteroides sp.]|uniref:sialate O-acetylesterase n=1 Tax=uncultured Bacteroides sp. TaxID=162156 RepID=UPI0025F06CCC|nr:sialate O-acetylesterase [uncultured Bacteroides sp.]
MKKRVLAFIFTGFSLATAAQVKLPAIFSDNMVLQQQADVPIWGKASPGARVTVKSGWDNKQYTATVASDSTWKVCIHTPAASNNNFELTISSGKERTVLKEVAIGEVWLCSGQSNMEMPMKGFPSQPILGGLDDIVHSTNSSIRCFTVKRNSSITPQTDCVGSWESASPNTTPDFTATGYYFARLLQELLQIPVGIIHSSWGGASIEAWMPRECFAAFPHIKVPNSQSELEPPHTTPTGLYNGMLYPFIGFTLKGAIWYQGETNASRYRSYPELFKAMHHEWNKAWGCGDFPIYFCQIAPHKEPLKAGKAFMREAQMLIAQTQPRTGIAILMDAGDLEGVHPANKRVAGERLAYIALARDYGYKNLPHEAPVFRNVTFKENGMAVVSFDKIGTGLSTFGEVLTGFELAGEDRKFYPAKASINRYYRTVEVTSDQVPHPIAVRYAFKGYIKGTLFGSNGLPISSFRSDKWNDVE